MKSGGGGVVCCGGGVDVWTRRGHAPGPGNPLHSPPAAVEGARACAWWGGGGVGWSFVVWCVVYINGGRSISVPHGRGALLGAWFMVYRRFIFCDAAVRARLAARAVALGLCLISARRRARGEISFFCFSSRPIPSNDDGGCCRCLVCLALASSSPGAAPRAAASAAAAAAAALAARAASAPSGRSRSSEHLHGGAFGEEGVRELVQRDVALRAPARRPARRPAPRRSTIRAPRRLAAENVEPRPRMRGAEDGRSPQPNTRWRSQSDSISLLRRFCTMVGLPVHSCPRCIHSCHSFID